MNRVVGLCVLLVSGCTAVFSQVDTTFIYNTSMPYGTLDLRVAKSPTRYYYLQEDTTFSFRESTPGVKTHTYRDMTSWNSAPYRQGNLRERNGTQDYFVMNYRMLMPNNYNASYSPGYPIIIMLHGYGERGNCWNNNCYWSTPSWNPNTNSPPAPTTVTQNLLNNDHNLLHGGFKHLTAVNLAGSKLPDDPTLPAGAFPGFVLFPQSLNGWQQSARVEEAIKLLRLIIKKYNIDENRVYIHALSNGGGGLYQAVKRAPWLFAAALPMSAVTNSGILNEGMAVEVAKTPFWVFQGGQDANPTPTKTYHTIKGLREAGAVVRYSLYPNLGHGTWNTAYNEPDFFSWMLQKRKYNPHIYFGNPKICVTTGAGVRIAFPKGFFAYQWEKDGEIQSENGAEYVANTPGIVRGRFSRQPDPQEDDWEPWSDPIVVTEIEPAKPSLEAIGSTHLRGPGLGNAPANNTVVLRSKVQAELYTWYRNGVALNFSTSDVNDTLRTVSIINNSQNGNGAYTLKTSYSYCPSPASDPVHLYFNNSAPQNVTLEPGAVNFSGTAIGSGVFLTWNDVANNEFGYEIWRRKSGAPHFVFAGRTEKDAIAFYDSILEPETTYAYKLRSVSTSGRSNYIPSNDLAINFEITTGADAAAPSAPQQLAMSGNTINSITLSWKPAADNMGIHHYLVTYGSHQVSTDTSLTTYTITGLPPNTEYAVSVRAVDHANHVSPSSNQIMASTYVEGLFYKHSTGGWEDLDDSTLVKTWTHPEFTGKVNNFTLVPRTQEDFFNFQFTGYVDILEPGDYRFRITSDDGSRLLLDGAVLADNDGTHGNISVESDTVSLAAGPHALEVQYFEYSGGQNLSVQCKGPDLSAAYKNIPDSLFRSGKQVPGVAPGVPTGLAIQDAGIQSIGLSWQQGGGANVEIYRSLQANGSFAIVGRTAQSPFTDTVGLLPATTFYYKVRAVSPTGISGFSTVVSATTLADSEPPSTPSGLTLATQTHTHVAFTWVGSTDNIRVKGYEIYSADTVIGESGIAAHMISGLAPGYAYSFRIRAVDDFGNRSGYSTPLIVTTEPSAVFYSAASGPLNALGTWKQNPDGTGSSPENFSDDGQFFVVSNRTVTGMGGPWDISGAASRVIVASGVILNADHAFSGSVELEGNAVLNLDHVNAPHLQKLSEQSTVVFRAIQSIPAKAYGHVYLTGTSNKVFAPGVTTILGNLEASDGVTLKGASGNASTVILGGDLLVDGAVGVVPADNAIHLRFKANGDHVLQADEDVNFFQLTVGENATLNLASAQNDLQIRTGSLNGGGVSIGSGSTLVVGEYTLKVVHEGAVNSGGESGQIAVDGGSLLLASGAPQHSHLYFDPEHNAVDTLSINFSGAGKALVHNAVAIVHLLDIPEGELQAGGHVTLTSSENGSAAIGELGGSVNGSIIAQRYVDPENGGWRDLSVSVSGLKVSDWQEYFPITGSFQGASSGAPWGNDPSLFVSAGSGMSQYPSESSSSEAPLLGGKGYAVRFGEQPPFVMALEGEPFQGNIAVDLDEGWNLVGNPYAAAIAWSSEEGAWLRSGVGGVAAVKESKVIAGLPAIQYKYYDPSLGEGVIKPGQGFWVYAETATASLTIGEKAKTFAVPAYPLQASASGYLVITLRQGAIEDPAYIVFDPDASDGFDPEIDGLKRSNEGMFNLSIRIQDGNELAVSHVAEDFCSKTINVSVDNTPPGNYRLSFDGLSTLEEIGVMSLTDHFTGATVPLTPTGYNFSVTSDPASHGDERFTLTFDRAELDVASPQVSAPPVCAGDTPAVNITHTQPGVEYYLINDAGVQVSDPVEGGDELIVLEVPATALDSGINHLNVRAAFTGCTPKLLTAEANLLYTPAFSIQVQQDVTVCVGQQAMLQASGVPSGGHYQWFDGEGDEIPGSGGSFVTPAVIQETTFFVSGVLANGCQSERETIRVYADSLEMPVITEYQDTLFTQVAADVQWKKDGSPIAGATSPFYKPTTSGSYTVMAFSEGCARESEEFAYVIDPDCQINTGVAVEATSAVCGGDVWMVRIIQSQHGVVYFLINSSDEKISAEVAGNGNDLALEVASAALDSGTNQVRIRAEFEGCVDRVLNTAPNVFYSPVSTPLLFAEQDQLLTDATGAITWKKDGQVIAGHSGSSYTPVVSGVYTVVNTIGPCSWESAPVEFLVTAIDAEQPEFQLNVFPVPAKWNTLKLEVESPDATPVLIRILDAQGQEIFRCWLSPVSSPTGTPTVPFSGPVSEGLYVVIASQRNHEIRKRLIIKH